MAAIRASQLGLKTAVVESGKLGGTCLHVGCIPTKALLESSGLFHKAGREEFGLTAEKLGFADARIAARRDEVVEQLWRGVQGLMRKNKVDVVEARGVMADARTVRAGDRSLRAKRGVIVATGSRPRGLPGVDFDGERVINSDHATLAGKLPKSVVIVGAGAIGVEFATLYQQLGVPVTVVEALDRLVPLEDPDVSVEMARQFKARGIRFRTGARVKAVEETREGVHVAFEEGEPVEADKLLVAIGREPLSEDIGLEAAGVKVGKGGFVEADQWMRTSAEGVWAIGDLVGGFLLAHAAAHEGIVAAEDIAGKRATPMEQELVTRCTYSEPQIASVGLTEPQARERGHEVKVGKFPFMANGRALIHGEPGGFAKLVSDAKTGQLLGAHIVGVEATELIAEPALARLFQGDAWEIGRNIHPHPTLSEVVGEAALAVDGAAIHI
ncbi:MAG: dihydrolipoyl dehydrogenase [Chloroflexota bacterium]